MVENSRDVGMQSFSIGQRIMCDGSYGTIHYIGTVDDTTGIWLGIDWDHPARGKHNGTYHDREYFKTRYLTSGSFVRPGKVKTGISCVEAIKNRYGLIDDDLAGVDKEDLITLRKEMNAPFLEMVGFPKVNRKQSNFDQLRIVSVREECISSCGKANGILEFFPNIEELDLSKNLINSWIIIADVCSQLRNLDRLNVSENVMPADEELNHINETFPNVRQLTMALMNYNWKEIQACTLIFPALRTLCVPFNIANKFDRPINNSPLQRLQTLILEGNSISNWEEVLKLGCLECLENLNLNSNYIERITFPIDDDGGKTRMFPALQQLHLSYNLISEWSSITELEKLVNLVDFKFRDNPVLKEESLETVRQLIIARISKLEVLNATEISAKERRDAEYDYMKLFAKDWLQLAESNSDVAKKKFLSIHPRYSTLIEKHGGPEIISSKGDEMKSDVITVEFIGMNESIVQEKGIKRKLLKEMDVQKLTGIARRLFKTGGRIPKLSFVQSNVSLIVWMNQLFSKEEIPLDKPLQQLRYYSIQNGDRVLVRW